MLRLGNTIISARGDGRQRHAGLGGYQLRFAFDDVQVGEILTASTAQLWEPFNATYVVQETGFVEISIVNVSGRTFPNDFMLDDISLTEIQLFEPGLPNWPIYIDVNNNAQLDRNEPTTVTDTNGDYVFTGLTAGTYIVREDSRTGWQQTFPTAVAPANGSHSVTLATGQIVSGIDLGNTFTGDPANGKPVFSSTAVTTGVRGQLYRYDAKATDPNNDPLTYGIVSGPEGITVHPTLGAVVWVPTKEQVGSHSVVISVRDDKGEVALQQFTIDVLQSNSAPSVTSTPPVNGERLTLLSYTKSEDRMLTAIP